MPSFGWFTHIWQTLFEKVN